MEQHERDVIVGTRVWHAKGVVGMDKHFDHSLQRFQLTGEASAPPCAYRDVMPQVGVDALHRETVALISNIANVLARIDGIHVA